MTNIQDLLFDGILEEILLNVFSYRLLIWLSFFFHYSEAFSICFLIFTTLKDLCCDEIYTHGLALLNHFKRLIYNGTTF